MGDCTMTPDDISVPDLCNKHDVLESKLKLIIWLLGSIFGLMLFQIGLTINARLDLQTQVVNLTARVYVIEEYVKEAKENGRYNKGLRQK